LDVSHARVAEFDPDGSLLSSFGSPGSGDGQLSAPFGITLDSQGDVYVAELGADRVQQFSSAGVLEDKVGGTGTGNGQFSGPTGVATIGASNLYVADRGNHRVQRFEKKTQSGTVAIAGTTLLVRARPGVANDFAVAADNGALTVVDGAAPLDAIAPCKPLGVSQVSCPSDGISLIVVDAHDGDDAVDMSVPLPGELLGGGGNDVLTGGPANDALAGDRSLAPTSGAPGDDVLDAGAGADLVEGGLGNDSFEGGPGSDSADYSSSPTPVAVDLSITSAQSTGAGDDRLGGIENLIGGAAGDRLSGNDVVNAISGGSGDDLISVRDQSADAADCGSGLDSVEADPSDSIAADCEDISLPDTTAPTITHLFASLISRRSGGTFYYTLSEPASVELTVSSTHIGFGKACQKERPGGRGPWFCLLLRQQGVIATSGLAGANRYAFSGRLGGETLRPGIYVLTAVATDPAGNTGLPASTFFLVH
jgi:hypothetical protein